MNCNSRNAKPMSDKSMFEYPESRERVTRLRLVMPNGLELEDSRGERWVQRSRFEAVQVARDGLAKKVKRMEAAAKFAKLPQFPQSQASTLCPKCGRECSPTLISGDVWFGVPSPGDYLRWQCECGYLTETKTKDS